MALYASMILGFLGLVSGDFGAGPIPIGAATGAPTYGDVNTVVVHGRQAPAVAGIFVPIHIATDFYFVTAVSSAKASRRRSRPCTPTFRQR